MTQDHPTTAEGVVRRKICFEWDGNVCVWEAQIQVLACNDGDGTIYHMYELVPTKCYDAYCVLDVE